MSIKDRLPVDARVEINQDEIDGQQDDLVITSTNQSKAVHGQEYQSYDDLDWSSGGDSGHDSALFMG